MPRGLTKEEDEFNTYILTKGNYNTFRSDKFDSDPELKKLLDYYCFRTNERFTHREFGRRLDEYFEIHTKYPKSKFPLLYLDNNHNKDNKKKSDGFAIQELFKIDNLSTAMSISGKEYRMLGVPKKLYQGINKRAIADEDKRQGFHRKTPDEKIKENPERNQRQFTNGILRTKIKEWLQYCLAITQAEKFIKSRYSFWNDKEKKLLTPAKRRKVYEELKILAEQLKVFDNSVYMVIAFEDISTSAQKHKMFQKLKIDKLLSLELPNIDTKDKAKAITEHLISPYQSFEEEKEAKNNK